MDEFGIKKLMDTYWKNKIILIIICVIAIVCGIIYTINKEPKYESTTHILFAKSNNINEETDNSRPENNQKKEDVEFSEMLINTYIELVKSDVVINKAIAKMENEDRTIKVSEIINSLEVNRSSDEAIILKIKAIYDSPNMAQCISKNVSEAFLETIKEYYGMENAYIITEAKEANVPCNVNNILDLIVFFIVGFALASIIIYIKTMYQNKKELLDEKK